MSSACPGCGTTAHRDEALFCFRCGHPLAAAEAAGETTREKRRGTGTGYTPAHLEGVLSAPGVGGGERKDVAVLFADVAGSLAMAATLDPEDVHAVMNGFFAIANEAVHEESGSINQYRGDGFMALFGAPRALQDNAARACRAALEIRRATERYAESVRARFGQPFVLRMGINAGLVWVGSIGSGLREDYTAEGPTVGVAARVEDLAPPGQILATGEVQSRTGSRFEWADLGPRKLRGIEEPLAVVELLREVPGDGRLAVEWRQGPLPWVDRPEQPAFVRAVSGAGLRRLEVVGEAGIGKSRMVIEGIRRELPDHDVLILPCREAGRQRAYQPFTEALKSWPADREGRDLAERVLGRISGSEPRPGDPGALELLVRLVDHQLTRRPLAIFVDDANWLDPSSDAVMSALCETPPERELLLVATRRDGAEMSGALRGATRIALGSLSADQSEQLACAILGDDPGAVELARLAAIRSGGNPLFVEELARSLREGSAGLRRVARLELALDRSPEEVPRDLRGVVAARIDALPVAEKRALEAAAVLGQPFDIALLRELGIDAGGLAAELQARGLFRHGEARGSLDFRHGVVREVAYEQLVRSRKRELHGRAARALKNRDGSSSAATAAIVGSHFDAAGEIEEAARHLLFAGRHFARLEAPAEGAVHLRRGLELLSQLPKADPTRRAEASIVLATCLNALDRSAEAGAALAAIDTAAVPASEQLLLARSLIQTGWVRFSERGDGADARSMIERGMGLAARVDGGGKALSLGHNFLCRIAILEGDTEQARAGTLRAIEHALANGDDLTEGAAFYNRSFACADAGDLEGAREAATRCQAVSQRREDDLLRALAVIADARVAYFEGDADGAVRGSQRGLRQGEKAGQVGLVYGALVVEGYAELLRGRPREANACFEELARLKQPWPTTELHCARGRLELGDLEGAIDLAAVCLDNHPPPLLSARAMAVRGLALGLRSAVDIDEAERAIADSVSQCDRLGLRPYRAEAHEFLSELWAARGDEQSARYYRDRAESGYRECGMHAFAARSARTGSQARSLARG